MLKKHPTAIVLLLGEVNVQFQLLQTAVGLLLQDRIRVESTYIKDIWMHKKTPSDSKTVSAVKKKNLSKLLLNPNNKKKKVLHCSSIKLCLFQWLGFQQKNAKYLYSSYTADFS